MLGFGTIALFFSTLSDSALGAALASLAVLIASSILQTLDAADAAQALPADHYWLSWIDFFRDPIFWHNINNGLLLQAGYIAVFFARVVGELRHQGRHQLSALGAQPRALTGSGLGQRAGAERPQHEPGDQRIDRQLRVCHHRVGTHALQRHVHRVRQAVRSRAG